MIGIVKSQSIGKAKNGTKQVRLLQVSLPGNDVCTVQWIGQPGTDSCPVMGSRVSVMDVCGTLYGVASQDAIVPTTQPGETEIYSTADGTGKRARVKAKANGKVYIASVNGGANLRDALDNLSDAIITFSGAASQNALALANATAPSLAAAFITLLAVMNSSITAAKASLDSVLDKSE